MNREIAFFDFDGTITTKDTLLEFIRFSKGNFGFYSGFLLNSPYLVSFKIGLMTNQQAKEKILSWYYRDESLVRFQEYCHQFSQGPLNGLIRPGALTEIARLREKGTDIVIVSASPRNWIEGFARSVGAELIATQMEITGDKLTGKIAGKNCYGEEKVRRIKERYTLPEYDHILAYGDSPGDKAMLALANEAFYQPFR